MTSLPQGGDDLGPAMRAHPGSERRRTFRVCSDHKSGHLLATTKVVVSGSTTADRTNAHR